MYYCIHSFPLRIYPCYQNEMLSKISAFKKNQVKLRFSRYLLRLSFFIETFKF